MVFWGMGIYLWWHTYLHGMAKTAGCACGVAFWTKEGTKSI
jgi:hypothetical protein